MTGAHVIKQFSGFLADPDEPLRNALTRLNAVAFQIVVDKDMRPVGTLTDGDARRSILGGASLNDAVGRCMNASPTIGLVGRDDRNWDLVDKLGFLPLVDKKGRLSAILERLGTGVGIGTALVMAGGRGTRLGTRTKTTPKPLLPVGGKPILEHIIERLEQAGVSKIFLTVHYLATQFEQFVARRKGNAVIEIVREPAQLGTAGALGLVRQHLAEPFLVVNADVLTDVNYGALRAFHDRHNFDGTVCIAQHRTKIPFGVVRHDDSGLFDGVDEKPELVHFIAAGINYFSPEFAALVESDAPTDMPELLNRAQKAGLKIGLFPLHEYWTDVGTPDSLDAADRRHGSKKSRKSKKSGSGKKR
jgi:dTDP-glucose pyrophosphorylase